MACVEVDAVDFEPEDDDLIDDDDATMDEGNANAKVDPPCFCSLISYVPSAESIKGCIGAKMACAEVDAVDFEPEDDDLMDDDDATMDEGNANAKVDTVPSVLAAKLKSTITGIASQLQLSDGHGCGPPKKTKGRGFREESDVERNTQFAAREFDSLDSDGGPGPQRSIEGWIILVTGVHEEAQEVDLQELFGEYGEINNLHLNLDHRTGFVKELFGEYGEIKNLHLNLDRRTGFVKVVIDANIIPLCEIAPNC